MKYVCMERDIDFTLLYNLFYCYLNFRWISFYLIYNNDCIWIFLWNCITWPCTWWIESIYLFYYFIYLFSFFFFYRPIDLQRIKRNIESGAIRTTAEFQRDMMLMFLNATMYNTHDHNVYHMAHHMMKDAVSTIQVSILSSPSLLPHWHSFIILCGM